MPRKKVALSTRIDPITLKTLRKFAEDTGRKIGYVIEQAIQNYLEKTQKGE